MRAKSRSKKITARSRGLLSAGLLGAALTAGCGAPGEEPGAAIGTSTAALTASEVRDHSNTQVRIPGDLYLGDVTGDGLADWIAVKGDKIFVASTSFEANGYAYGKVSAPVQRVVTGKFRYSDKSQICAITASATLSCYRTSADNRQLQPSWSQPNFIASDEEAIVGDFDGSGLDDVLVYKPSAGTFRMYSWSAGGSLQPTPNFVLGNLDQAASLRNMQVRVGNFSDAAGEGIREDLLLFDPAARLVRRYSGRRDAAGQATFWWAFTTAGNSIGANEEVTVARVDGNASDDVVLHDTVTGGYRFFEAEYNAGQLRPLSQGVGQLPIAAGTRLYWAKLKSTPTEAGASDLRHDALVHYPATGLVRRTDARWDGSARTYWWAYTQRALVLDQDQDGDGLSTREELGGYDLDNDGVSDEPLQRYGASPFGKDIFVEVDYMAAGPGETADHRMRPEAINLATQEMAKFGINLHIMQGTQIPFQANLGNPSFDWVRDFDPIKNANFTRSRWGLYHYAVFASRFNGGTTSGVSRGIVASDLLVTLGGWGSNPGTVEQQAGTFLHELGHNLGLLHGGPDSVNNKPNDLSIMNYMYQTSGLMKNGQRQFLYSELTVDDLDENALWEPRGIHADTGTNVFQAAICDRPGLVTLNTPIDWNLSGIIDGVSVGRDVNCDGARTLLKGGVNEYARLVYNGGLIGTMAAREVKKSEADPSARLRPLLLDQKIGDELDYPTYLRIAKPIDDAMPPLDLSTLRGPRDEYQPLRLIPKDLK